MKAVRIVIKNDGRVCASFDLGLMGFTLLDKSINTKKVYKFPCDMKYQ
jgi:hypothetical protein